MVLIISEIKKKKRILLENSIAILRTELNAKNKVIGINKYL